MTGRRLLRALLATVAATVALAVLALLAVMVLVPMATGWVPLTIVSGSMTPTYPVGTQVYVERIESQEQFDRLRTGDVISFMPRPNDLTMVTHRIVGMQVGSDGTRTLVTRGDANNAVDHAQVQRKMVRGKVRYAVPYVGYVATALDGGQKRMGILAAVGLLLAYAVFQLLQLFRRRPAPAVARGRSVASVGSAAAVVRTGATRYVSQTAHASSADARLPDTAPAPTTRAEAKQLLAGRPR